MPLGDASAAAAGNSLIIAYTRKGIHADGRVLLYTDSHVEYVTEDRLHTASTQARDSFYASYHALIDRFAEQLSEERRAELKRFYEVE